MSCTELKRCESKLGRRRPDGFHGENAAFTGWHYLKSRAMSGGCGRFPGRKRVGCHRRRRLNLPLPGGGVRRQQGLLPAASRVEHEAGIAGVDYQRHTIEVPQLLDQ